ncbi:MAG: DUF2934 domain-containing protein [Betaproteobacteria bacterium]|nr:DUF2934 domain-containing protein [Betaproteobacteria bacterium]
MNSPDLPNSAKRAASTRKPRVSATTNEGTKRRATAGLITQSANSAISAEERRRMVEVCAYFLAEQRGFAPGNDQQDWLEAEARIAVMLAPAARKASSRRTTQ